MNYMRIKFRCQKVTFRTRLISYLEQQYLSNLQISTTSQNLYSFLSHNSGNNNYNNNFLIETTTNSQNTRLTIPVLFNFPLKQDYIISEIHY